MELTDGCLDSYELNGRPVRSGIPFPGDPLILKNLARNVYTLRAAFLGGADAGVAAKCEDGDQLMVFVNSTLLDVTYCQGSAIDGGDYLIGDPGEFWNRLCPRFLRRTSWDPRWYLNRLPAGTLGVFISRNGCRDQRIACAAADALQSMDSFRRLRMYMEDAMRNLARYDIIAARHRSLLEYLFHDPHSMGRTF